MQDDPNALYLITKGGAYYRPNAEGYTRHKSEAGRFTLADAISYSHPNGPDGPRDGIAYEPAPVAMQDDELKALVERLPNLATLMIAFGTDAKSQAVQDIRKAATALETLDQQNAGLKGSIAACERNSDTSCAVEALTAERDEARAEVERLREFERRVTAEGMETANRYWEARYRDEAAQLTATQARLEEAVGHLRRMCGNYSSCQFGRALDFLAKQENPNG